jgi:hypothetical protein
MRTVTNKILKELKQEHIEIVGYYVSDDFFINVMIQRRFFIIIKDCLFFN